MRLKGSTYFLMFLLLLVSIFISVAVTWRFLEDKLVWLLITIPLLVMVIAELIKDIRAQTKTKMFVASEVGEGVKAKVESRRFYLAMGWLLGFLLTTYLAGFLISIPLFTCSYLKVQGRSWLRSIIFTILLLAALYAIFTVGLRVRWYKGLLFLL